MSISIKEVNDINYGRCIDISNGIVDVSVTIDYGPRIIRYCPKNMKNLFYYDRTGEYTFPQNLVNTNELFYLYGGHRMWISTESGEKSNYPDNVPIVYSPITEGVKLSIPRDIKQGIALYMDIILTQETTNIMVVHSVQNISKVPMEISINADTALCKSGFVYSMQSEKNKIIQLYNSSKWQDKRLFISDDYITADASNGDEFYIGIKNAVGCCGYVDNNVIFNKRYIHNTNLEYPNGDISTKIKILNGYISLDTISPLYVVESGEIVRHVESWSYERHNYNVNDIDRSNFIKYFSSEGV